MEQAGTSNFKLADTYVLADTSWNKLEQTGTSNFKLADGVIWVFL
jgi:hypothetical protein